MRALPLGEAEELRSSGQLDRNIVAWRRDAEGHWVRAGELSAAPDTPSFGSAAAVSHHCARLGLVEHSASLGVRRRSKALADTAFAMVANCLIDPRSKRGSVFDWMGRDTAVGAFATEPSFDQCYRALDAVAAHKKATEAELYAHLELRSRRNHLSRGHFSPSPRPDEVTARFPRDLMTREDAKVAPNSILTFRPRLGTLRASTSVTGSALRDLAD